MIIIGISIATYKRLNGLEKLLDSILEQKFYKNKNINLKIAIVDNDHTGSAEATVEKFRKILPWEILYDIEKNLGIPYARNKSVALLGKVDFVVFVDDDEIVDNYWIDELVNAQKKYSADVITGPVYNIFPSGTPLWLSKADLFVYNEVHYPSGSLLQSAATNNTLVKWEVINKYSGPFDISFAFTGGSDSMLFRSIYRDGYSIVWTEDAKVCEYIPETRTAIRWIVLRAYRKGVTRSKCEKKLFSGHMRLFLLVRIAKSLFRIISSALFFVPTLFYGKKSIIINLCNFARGCGMFLGLFGINYEEYRRIHGN